MKKLVDIWLEEFMSTDDRGIGHCGLCGNTGKIYIDNIYTPARQKLKPLKAFCICPNGRAYKRKGKVEL